VNNQLRSCAVLLITISAMAIPAWQQDSRNSGAKLPGGPQWIDFLADMEKMHAGMASVQPSSVADIDFVRLMIPHHQAAIDMAKTQLLYGGDSEMRRLAQEIITDQQSEIQLMQLWLDRHPPGSAHKHP
jgi:uncharacterized protein (DUF305 family)